MSNLILIRSCSLILRNATSTKTRSKLSIMLEISPMSWIVRKYLLIHTQVDQLRILLNFSVFSIGWQNSDPLRSNSSLCLEPIMSMLGVWPCCIWECMLNLLWFMDLWMVPFKIINYFRYKLLESMLWGCLIRRNWIMEGLGCLDFHLTYRKLYLKK